MLFSVAQDLHECGHHGEAAAAASAQPEAVVEPVREAAKEAAPKKK